MAGHVAVEEALARYEQNLGGLTFNCKPLIDNLTRAADQLKSEGEKIVEMIQKRIMKVAEDELLFIIFIIIIYNYYFVFCCFIIVVNKNPIHYCANGVKIVIKSETFIFFPLPPFPSCRFVQSGNCHLYIFWTRS